MFAKSRNILISKIFRRNLFFTNTFKKSTLMNKNQWFQEWDANKLYKDQMVTHDLSKSSFRLPDTGIICGPMLRLIQVDYEKKLYHASMMIVTSVTDGPDVSYISGPSHLSEECEFKSGEFPRKLIYKQKGYSFYRYSIILPLQDFEQVVKYQVNDIHVPHYRFFIPSSTMNFNVISYSCNGFSLSVDTSKFKGSLWYDILCKHSKVHYHVILGGGDQIYSDSIKIHCERFKEWVNIRNIVTKRETKLTDEFSEDIDDFYLDEYIKWYGYGYWNSRTDEVKTNQSCFPIALSTIPYMNIWDDHDIIDGFGSYSNDFMTSEVFTGLARIAYKYYMLFQHQVSLDESDEYLKDPLWILGSTKDTYMGEQSHSIFTRIGPNAGVLGLDCRTERKLKQVCSNETYDLVFQRLSKEVEQRHFDHLMVMLAIPIAFPRLMWLEWLFSSAILYPLKYLSQKNFISRKIVNDFDGDIEILDDLVDHWTSRHHKQERHYLINRLQEFSMKYGTRITILSGDVHLSAIGRFRSKLNNPDSSESSKDSRLMFNLISSAITNEPSPDTMAHLLQQKTRVHDFDANTTEDMIPLFFTDVNNKTRKNNKFMNRRNWLDIIPIENILGNEYLNKLYNIKVGDVKMPGLLECDTGHTECTNANDTVNNQHIEGCFVTDNSLIATIHVEKDSFNVNSETVPYTLTIPKILKT